MACGVVGCLFKNINGFESLARNVSCFVHGMRLITILLALAGCATPLDLDEADSVDGRADGAVAALEGTREGDGVLKLLNDTEGTTFELLDDDVRLDRRAAANLIETRDGADGLPGTEDDVLFETIAQVDEVRWVGATALDRLAEFARLNDYVPGDDQLLGTYDGVDFTYVQGELVLDLVNDASEQVLADASVPSRAIASIVDARPIASIGVLAELYWVGPRTLEHLLAAVTVVGGPAGGEVCTSNAECTGGLRCVGLAYDGEYSDEGHPPGAVRYGLCRDTSNRDGIQDDCNVDSDCGPRLICIGQTVYTQGYCADDWMRGTYTVGGESSIPAVVMTEPTGSPVLVMGQASVPEDIIVDLDIEHSDPSSLWIGLQPPTGQEAVTLWDGATMTGPIPSRIVDRRIERDNSVNGRFTLLIQNVGGRGEGVFRGYSLTVTSRWD